jgi:methylglutaconyl-CoA hydratase
MGANTEDKIMALDRINIEAHIDQLNEDTKPLWGILTPQHLIEHFIYLFRMSVGEIKEKTVTPADKLPAYQASLHYDRRLPKNFESPYLKEGSLEDLEYDSLEDAKAAFKNYFDQYEAFYQEHPAAKNDHVIYGALDKEHWGLIHAKHFDHHFRQFDLKTKVADGYVDRFIETGGIGVIEFFHPAHNSLPGRLLNAIVEALIYFSDHEHCKVILLRSGGDRTFCAGASFEELKSISNPEEGEAFFLGFANVLNAIRTNRKLVIGRVQGKAVGGGVGIASAVDYCFATKYASIKLSELGIGIGPFVIGPAVERKIGLSAFAQLSLDFTKFFTPDWAERKGIYQEVYESTEEMDRAVSTFCQNLATTNPEARRKIKSMFWEGSEFWPSIMKQRAQTSGTLVLSDFTKASLEGK